MFFLNQGNIPKLSLPEDTDIMLLEVGLTVPDEKSVQEKTKSFKVFSNRMTLNWVKGRGGGQLRSLQFQKVEVHMKRSRVVFLLFLGIRNVTFSGPFPG